MKKQNGSPDRARGARFKSAAKQKGMTSARIGELIGTEDGSVRGYWSGAHVPSADKLQRYAEVTGVSVEWLLYGPKGPAEQRRFSELVVHFFERVMAGEDPTHAHDALSARPEALSGPQREAISRGAAEIRRYVAELTGARWEDLSPEQRRQALERLAAAEEAKLDREE